MVTLAIPDLVVDPEEHLQSGADEGSDGLEHDEDHGMGYQGLVSTLNNNRYTLVAMVPLRVS